MKYNPKIHHRRSIRLKGYDYAQQGLYFVTICCENKAHLYGKIANGKMILNDAGQMTQKWYYELENKFPDIRCQEMIIMPNHFHCIIENTGTNILANSVRADLRVCPNAGPNAGPNDCPDNTEYSASPLGETPSESILGKHVGSPLYRVIQWYKTMTTNEYIRNVKSNNWKRFDGKLWQRNYWEHIIRDEQAYHNIAEYIKSNPSKWGNDTLNTKKINLCTKPICESLVSLLPS